MSDLTLALRLLADTSGAEGGLKKLAASLRELGAEQKRTGAAGDAAADQTAAAWTEAAARIEAAAAAGPRAAGQNAELAAGQIGNLVAQFNDIGQMLMAGQNPLQLAVQQGMQISQVLGPMGAAGAARALGQAFLGMLNPINLITVGSIAAGAALVGWLTSGAEKALTLDEAMDALESGVGAYEKAAKAAAQTTAELREQFGDAANDAKELLREIAKLEAGAAARALADVSEALRVERGLVRNDGRTDTGALADLFELSRFGRGREKRQAQIGAVSAGFSAVTAAAGIEDEAARIDAMAEATRRLRDAFAAAADASGDRSDQEKEILRVLGEQVLAAARLKEIKDAQERAARAESRANEDRTTRARPVFDGLDANASNQRRQGLEAEARLGGVIAQHGRESLEAARARVLAERERYEAMLRGQAISEAQRSAELAAWDAAKGLPALERDRLATAQALLAELQQQGAIQQAIKTYGEDSAQVARARVDAERAAFAALVDQLVPAGDLRDRLMEAWENAEGLGRADMSGNLAAAAAQARAIADELGRAVANAQSLAAAGVSSLEQARINYEFRNDPVQRARALARARFDAQTKVPAGTDSTVLAVIEAERRRTVETAGETETWNQRLLAWQQAQNKARGGSGGGKGAGRDGLAGLTGEAQKMLAELGIAQGAVTEKVRAGLMSVAEGEREMASAKARAAERLAELIARLDSLGPAGKAAADEARAALAGLGAEAASVGETLEKSLIETFEDSFARSLATGKNAMSAFADHVKMELARAFTQKFVTPMISPLINSLMGMFTGIFSAKGNVIAAGRVVPFASGGVPDLPSLKSHSNTVVDRPTAFAMKGGQIGIMGEAGAEAILPLLTGAQGPGVRAVAPDGSETVLPLQRAADGALGVGVPDVGGILRRPTFFAKGGVVGRLTAVPRVGEATNEDTAPEGRAPRFNVVINNNHPTAQVTAEQRPGADGMSMDVVIEQIDAALADRGRRGIGPLSGLLGGTFGLTRQGR